ncbi:acyl carrier protein [Shewanella colwelliana]|uniref:ACP S-malonyltransferase n=1 Tax=Shewanella colwelliana TaxID=23 RepID=UPI001BBDB3D6|nr:ACP S-malonyltransferase [Shewanella colwelliana]GIU20534.1 acyl carrier protein [Shewanella colwelliana]
MSQNNAEGTGAGKKHRALVVAPGRGCYNKDELGYLKRHHQDKLAFIDKIDQYRHGIGQRGIAELDAQAKYSFKLHTPGENASALIYACAMADFMDIDTAEYEVVAVTGNSMGWYIALALAGALQPDAAIKLINTMGSMMSDGLIGGQLIYPEMNEAWQTDLTVSRLVDDVINQVNQASGCELFTSIYLGGYRVLAGNEAGMTLAETLLPRIDDKYPMRLYNHGAFHSPLLSDISDKGRAALPESLFNAPRVSLVDGQGKIWSPYSTDTTALYDYTLGKQVIEPYDFSKAIAVAVKEFAPDKIIVLGPGNTLGGPVAQALIQQEWFGWQDKTDFSAAQQAAPRLIAMGHDKQRFLATSHDIETC